MRPERGAAAQDRRSTGECHHYGAFVAAAQRAWDSHAGRAVLGLLVGKNVGDMTPAFALQHSVVLSLEVVCPLPYHADPKA